MHLKLKCSEPVAMVKPYRIRPFHFLSTFLHARFQSKRMIDFLFSSEDLPLSQDDLSGSCAAFHIAGLNHSFSSCIISRLGLSKVSNMAFVNHHEARVALLCLPSPSQRLCLRDHVSLSACWYVTLSADWVSERRNFLIIVNALLRENSVSRVSWWPMPQ